MTGVIFISGSRVPFADLDEIRLVAMVSGRIFDVQRFCIHDGPGIRTAVFLKGCPLKCLWCHNPEGMKPEFEIGFFTERCIRCGRCAVVCLRGAQIVGGERIFLRDRCENCGKCVEVCDAEALVLCGREVSTDEVVDEVEKDKLFYENSGGGVTLSGGEPLMQPEFTSEVLAGCHKRGIHTAIETAGFTQWKTLERVLPHLDLVLYDLKFIDSRKHQRFTGVPNEIILDNLQRLAKMKVDIILRLPLIPGYNDSAEDLDEMISFINGFKRFRNPIDVNMLPYHRFAEPKYARFGKEYALKGLLSQSDERIGEIVRLFRKNRINASVD